MKSSKFILFAGVAVCALACLAGVSKFVVYDQSVLVPSGTVGIGTNSTPVRLHVVRDLATNIIARFDDTNYTRRIQLSTLVGTPAYGAFYLGDVTPTANNFVLTANGTSDTFLNVPTSGNINFGVNGSADVRMNASTLFPVADLGNSLGDSTHRWQDAYIASANVGSMSVTGVTAQSVTATNIHGYTLTGWSQASLNPAGATTYFIGGETAVAPGTAFTNAQIRIPKTGVLKSIYVKLRMTTAGSSELVTNVFRINDTTDLTPIISTGYVAPHVEFETNLNHVVTAGDKLALKVLTPFSWGTPPVGVRWYWIAYIE